MTRRDANIADAAPARRGSAKVAAATAALLVLCAACSPYGFRFGTKPAHLNTIFIPTADDQSGYGRGTVAQELTDALIKRFRDDNSLHVVNTRDADSRLEVVITSITSVRSTLSSDARETTRNIDMSVRVIWHDNVKGGTVYEKVFTGRGVYDLTRGTAGETDAFTTAIEDVSQKVLEASVSMW